MNKKSFVVVLLLLIFEFCIYAQNQGSEPAQEPRVPYRLYKTTNNWIFIKLDTRTGMIWQLQYSVSDNDRCVVVLSDKNLAKDKKETVGRFTLYPTANIWTFILLDQIDGIAWQVQWAFDEEDRFILPIY